VILCFFDRTGNNQYRDAKSHHGSNHYISHFFARLGLHCQFHKSSPMIRQEMMVKARWEQRSVFRDESSRAEECPVCLEPYGDKESLLFRCCHKLCRECFHKMPIKKCPLCRCAMKIYQHQGSRSTLSSSNVWISYLTPDHQRWFHNAITYESFLESNPGPWTQFLVHANDENTWWSHDDGRWFFTSTGNHHSQSLSRP
jgi:hypothetical protein